METVVINSPRFWPAFREYSNEHSKTTLIDFIQSQVPGKINILRFVPLTVKFETAEDALAFRLKL